MEIIFLKTLFHSYHINAADVEREWELKYVCQCVIWTSCLVVGARTSACGSGESDNTRRSADSRQSGGTCVHTRVKSYREMPFVMTPGVMATLAKCYLEINPLCNPRVSVRNLEMEKSFQTLEII